ncbi:KR domain-containing protein, partial [Metarhizium majus ARSEF 297]
MGIFKLPESVLGYEAKSHIFNSRSTALAEGVMCGSNCRADVILNSCPATSCATWNWAAEWSIMIDIGKRDLLGAGKLDMNVSLENRDYCCVEISQMGAENQK